MLNFAGTKRLYAKGICNALLTDVNSGDVLYQSNKFNTGNITTSVTLGEIRAGLGNPIAAIIPSDSAMNVEFSAADFSLWAKAAQLGATVSYNGVAPVCQTVTASGTSLSIDVSDATPVAQYGFANPMCYVQETGVASTAADGTAYPVDASTGAISGFTATAAKTYKVWYFVQKASAKVATIGTMFDPLVAHFTAQVAVYANEAGAQGTGTRQGWLYIVVPYLKLQGNGGVTGDQGTNDTTSISGQAVAYDDVVVSATCADCESGTLAYYIYVPDDATEEVKGLALVGGVLTVNISSTYTISDFRLVMNDGSLALPDAAKMAYELTGAPTGTSVSGSVLTTGATAGDGEITATYTDGDFTAECVANLSVVSA